MHEVISSNTRNSSKKKIEKLEQKLSEVEKANSNLKIEKSELMNKNSDLEEQLALVTSELRELKEKSKQEIKLNEGKSIYVVSFFQMKFFLKYSCLRFF